MKRAQLSELQTHTPDSVPEDAKDKENVIVDEKEVQRPVGSTERRPSEEFAVKDELSLQQQQEMRRRRRHKHRIVRADSVEAQAGPGAHLDAQKTLSTERVLVGGWPTQDDLIGAGLQSSDLMRNHELVEAPPTAPVKEDLM